MATALQNMAAQLKRMQLGERLIRRNPIFYNPVTEQIGSVEGMDLAARERWSTARLATVLAAARRTPYGRDASRSNDITTWPLLEKAPVRDRFSAFVSGTSVLNASASTGGTTGVPLKLMRSPVCVAAEQAFIDRLLRHIGIEISQARVAVLRGDNIKDPTDVRPPFWRYIQGGNRLILSSNHLSRTTIAHYVDELRQFAPDILWVYPSSLEGLCTQLRHSELSLRIPVVLSSSEVLSPACWSLARDTLGCAVVDYYGQAERVAFAYAYEPGEYRFHPGYAYVELLEAGQDDAIKEYEIVGTSFWNKAMPLVRYRTGDLVRLPASLSEQELREVRYGLRSFAGVVGRNGQILYAPNGTRVTGIDHIPRDVDHILRIQVVQEALESVRILVQPSEGFSATDRDRLLHNARLKLPEGMDVAVEIVEQFEKSAAGKTPFVIHRPAVRAAIEASVS
jgi:phenylacetate-CoA ligase